MAAPTTAPPTAPTTAPPTALVVAAGLIGGYASARHAKRDDLATVVFAGAGVWCTRIWRRRHGRGIAAGLLGCYLTTFAVSHPLARRMGAWPSVLAMSAVAAAVTAAAESHRVPAKGHRVPADSHRALADSHRVPADSHRARAPGR